MSGIIEHKFSSLITTVIAAVLAISCNIPQKGLPLPLTVDVADTAVFRYSFQSGLQRAVDCRGKFGYLNSAGQWAIPAVYDLAYDFNEGIALVASINRNGDPAYSAISTSGNIILTINLKNCILDTQFSEGLLAFRETDSGRCGYINRNGETKIYLGEDIIDAYRFHNGKALAITSSGKGYIDMSGRMISFEADTEKRDDVNDGVTKSFKVKENLIESRNWSKIRQENPLYLEAKKVLDGNLQEKDRENRTMILNYVEHLRTAYTTEDIDFIEQVFSQDALIIVGKVVKYSNSRELEMTNRTKVQYNVLSKKNYIKHLKRIFAANEKIEVTFSDFRIRRHPTKDGIYGVTLRQAYKSSIYSDDGYLFLLWDFRDEAMPKIHVRTWQENDWENNRTIAQDSIIGIHNFNLQ